MTHTLIAICYKPNSEDYFRGHTNARYSSDCKIIAYLNDEEFIESVALIESTPTKIGEAGYQTAYIIGGTIFNADSTDISIENRADEIDYDEDDIETDEYVLKETLANRLMRAIQSRVNEMKMVIKQAEQQAEKEKIRLAEYKAKKVERAEYERLKTIYGG